MTTTALTAAPTTKMSREGALLLFHTFAMKVAITPKAKKANRVQNTKRRLKSRLLRPSIKRKSLVTRKRMTKPKKSSLARLDWR